MRGFCRLFAVLLALLGTMALGMEQYAFTWGAAGLGLLWLLISLAPEVGAPPRHRPPSE